MDFTFPATTATPELPPAAAGPAPSSACRQLPFPRFATTGPPLRFPPSPPPAVASRATAAGGMAEDEPRPPGKRAGPGAGAGKDDAASEAAELEDRMDLLWEDFNEELAQAARRRRAPPRVGGSWRERGGGLLVADDVPWWSESSPASDAESEPAAARAGCGPVLRPSARAAAGARHCRRRAGRWVLLMRIFRRLFVVEKTISAAAAVARQRSTTRAR